MLLDRLGSDFEIKEDCALVVDFEYFFQIVLYTITVFFFFFLPVKRVLHVLNCMLAILFPFQWDVYLFLWHLYIFIMFYQFFFFARWCCVIFFCCAGIGFAFSEVFVYWWDILCCGMLFRPFVFFSRLRHGHCYVWYVLGFPLMIMYYKLHAYSFLDWYYALFLRLMGLNHRHPKRTLNVGYINVPS